MTVGNPYAHRYKNKRETMLTEVEFQHYFNVAKELERKRLEQSERGEFPFDFRVVPVSVTGLLSTLYYTGLRVTEIVGDTPHKYMTKEGERWTEELHGLRKMDLSLEGDLIKVDVKEVRKHGRREEPVWIPLNKLGTEEIVKAWNGTVNPNDRVFPCSKWLAWFLVSMVTEKLYPHYFRLNRASKFASDERTSLMDLMKWFGWVDPRTVESYMGKAGRTTKPMVERL